MSISKLNKYCSFVLLLLFFACFSIDKIGIKLDSNEKDPFFPDSLPRASQPKAPFIYGTTHSPNSIDPLDMWDTYSYDVVCQSAEPLVDYNYSDPNYPIIPKLATDWYWHSDTEISFKIREGVFFHDGTLLTANSVAWNIYRLMWFCNYTGTLPMNSTSYQAFPSSLYYFPDGVTRIFVNATVNSMYNVSIFLLKPYGPVLNLLTTPAMYILSPASTPRYRYLDSVTEQVVGTGPFVFEYFIPGVEIKYHAYEDYWAGKADIEELFFSIYSDSVALNNALLADQVDFIKDPIRSYYPTIEGDPEIILLNGGEDLIFYYFEFYCGPGDPMLGNPWDYQILNSTWRRALSLAINYTYIWDEIQSGYANPGCPIVPRSMPGYNSSLEGKMVHDNPFGADFQSNVKKAREYMQSMGYGLGWDTTYPGTNEMDWMTALFRTIEVNQIIGYTTSQYLNDLLTCCWDLIGVNISVTVREWSEFLDTIEFSPWEIECSYLGWGADYLDPFSMLNPLLNNDSVYSYLQLNDPVLKSVLEALIAEINPITRMNMFKWIQSYIFDITRPENPSSYCYAPIYVFENYYAHHINLSNFIPNALDRLFFYTCLWNRTAAAPPILPGPFTLSTNAGSPDNDGIFDLIWTSSASAESYSVYLDSKPILEYNESLVLLTEGLVSLTYPLSGFTNGRYHFIVKAWNENGTTLSNSIYVDVQIPGSVISIFDGCFLNQSWIVDTFIYNMSFNYLQDIGSIYDVELKFDLPIPASLKVDTFTREVSEVQGLFIDVNGSHTNRWIYPSTQIGDYYLVSIDGEGDHIFQVTGESTGYIPGFGMLDYWILSDLSNPYGFAYYEKNTGVNLVANFSYAFGMYYYFTILNATNVFGIPSLPGPFTLSSTAGSPDNDGLFDLTWTSSSNADNYTVYEYNHYITEINGSLSLLTDQTSSLSLPLSGYVAGTYYFIVVAHNEHGNTLSNCIQVISTLGAPEPFTLSSNAGNPDNDGIFDLTWTSSINSDNYTVYEYNHYITEINGSLTTLSTEIGGLSLPLSGYSSGTYYFIVVAHNEYGDRLSNCIEVEVSMAAPGPFILLTTAETPDDDGKFDLVWTSSAGADTYSAFEYSSYITEINGSLTLLGAGITELTFPLSDYSNGTYYFVVTAHNVNGFTLSNCVVVIVAIPPKEGGPPGIPGYNVLLVIMSMGLGLVYLISKSLKKK
ncbi:MAG: ABC transporter substrate-binding protein [Promethearchaeota archaeon]